MDDHTLDGATIHDWKARAEVASETLRLLLKRGVITPEQLAALTMQATLELVVARKAQNARNN